MVLQPLTLKINESLFAIHTDAVQGPDSQNIPSNKILLKCYFLTLEFYAFPKNIS